MNSIIRRVVTAGAAALTLGAGSALTMAGTAGAATGAPAYTMPRCGINQVHTWLRETGQDARSTWYRVEFQNLRGFACSLHGYPGVSALNSGGTQIGQPAARHAFSVGGTPATEIPAHGTDSAILQVVNAGIFKGGAPRAAARLRVFMPGDGYSEQTPFAGEVTSRGHSNLYIGTVRNGADS